MSIIDELVTDRTRADVDRLELLNAKGWDGMTGDERGEWRYGREIPMLDDAGEQFIDSSGELLTCRDAVRRGAYNASDLNRVGAALNYIKALLVGQCGFLVDWTAKTDWTVSGEPTAGQMADYLSHVKDCRAKLAVAIQAPETMVRLTVDGANDIEKILVACDDTVKRIKLSFWYSGEIWCGEV